MTNVLTTAEYTTLQDKYADKSMTNQPRNHPTKQEYSCKCGAKADVWDAFDTYCASCYLAKQKDT